MELVDFIEKFAEQFDDVDVEQLNFATKFRELDGYTSLIALLIITMIDEEYDVIVTGDDMKQQVTIGDLYNLVSSRL
ncbi:MULTISPECIES: phosphopantetheine-binding protein [Bacteroides]|uniref:phosphopantetheine-binding protein n=1 Tax=Bacteroides TaxID=816 RepID=UPI001595B964|nr:MULTISPECIES: phosphopantetheine-binding protein [Bacteroides]MCM1955293.1 phosphopantetheine-binding protein [Bacteroides uniformis]NVK94741.1 acyl carrier protein [Bacteroides sp. L10-4]